MSSYIILPFNFKYSGDTVLMVNQAGEWLTISRNDFDKFHSYKLEAEDECYKRLKAKHFLTITEEKEQVLGLLAIKLRTRKAFAECSPNLHMMQHYAVTVFANTATPQVLICRQNSMT